MIYIKSQGEKTGDAKIISLDYACSMMITKHVALISRETRTSKKKLAAWLLLASLICIMKVVVAPWSLKQASVTAIANLFFFLLLTVCIIALLTKERPVLQRWIIEVIPITIGIYLIIEAALLIPGNYLQGNSYNTFLLLNILSSSLLLAYLSRYHHIIVPFLFLISQIYHFHLLLVNAQPHSRLLFPVLLLQSFFLILIFRMIKIITYQELHKEALLDEQEALNRNLASSTQRLIEQERLVSILKLSAGLNHEINNPLTYLQGNQFFLFQHLDKIEGGRDVKSSIQAIRTILSENTHGLKAIEEVVAKLRYFSKRADSEIRNFALHELLDSCVETELKLYDHKAIFDTANISEVYINGRPVDFATIAAGLIQHCMSLGKEDEGKEVKKTLFFGLWKMGDRVFMEIHDKTIFLPETDLEILNSKRFYLNNSWMQLSIGIAMCRSIVSDYQGSLQISSTQEEGTRFVLSFSDRYGA